MTAKTASKTARAEIDCDIQCPEDDCQSHRKQRMGFTWRKRDGVRTKVQRYRCCDCGRIYIEEVAKL